MWVRTPDSVFRRLRLQDHTSKLPFLARSDLGPQAKCCPETRNPQLDRSLFGPNEWPANDDHRHVVLRRHATGKRVHLGQDRGGHELCRLVEEP